MCVVVKVADGVSIRGGLCAETTQEIEGLGLLPDSCLRTSRGSIIVGQVDGDQVARTIIGEKGRVIRVIFQRGPARHNTPGLIEEGVVIDAVSVSALVQVVAVVRASGQEILHHRTRPAGSVREIAVTGRKMCSIS